MRISAAFLALLCACGAPTASPTSGDPGLGDPVAGDPAAGDSGAGDPMSCPLGHACNPIPIEPLPFVDTRNTAAATSSVIDTYACAAGTDESGPENFYSLTLSEAGILYARVDDVPDDDVDVDLHLLTGASGDDCDARDNVLINRHVDAGTYLLVVDTWV